MDRREFFKGTAWMGLAAAGCLLAGCCAQKADEARLQVAPGAALDSPQKALDEVLRLRKSGLVAQNRQIVVEIACGTYAVERPLEVTAAHGPLLLKGKSALGTVISGSRRLGLFDVELNGRVWRNRTVPAGMTFDQLFVNWERANLSSPSIRHEPWVPGAWCFDPDNRDLVYIARPGENPQSTITYAGVVDVLLRLGNAADVTVEGIAFMHNANGSEGADGAAVVCDGARRLTFANCAFSQCASYGLKVFGGSADVGVRHCRFDDAGSGAMCVSDAARVVFEDNVVTSCGTSPARAAVRIEKGRGCKVVHNDFCNLKCAGVSASGEGCESTLNRFWKVAGEKDSPREGEAGVSGEDPAWRARVEMLTF